MTNLSARRSELIAPLLVGVSLLIACLIVSDKKFYWMDELASFDLATDPSLAHMLTALGDQADSGQPLYFVLLWFWVKLWGASELSVRLFSSVSIGAACATVWITLRRVYPFAAACIGTFGVFCLSHTILNQNSEGRFYGLFLLSAALAVAHYQTMTSRHACSWRVLAVNALLQGCLVLTHLFGAFYSGAILLSILIRDRYSREFRPRVYLSFVVGWSFFLLWLQPFLNLLQKLEGIHTWVPVPDLITLLNLWDFDIYLLPAFLYPFLNLAAVILVLLLLTVGAIRLVPHLLRPETAATNPSPEREKELPLLILAYFFLLMPVAVWILSHVVRSFFVDRYMLPTTLGWSILMAHASSRIPQPVSTASRGEVAPQRLALLILLAFLLFHPINHALLRSAERPPDVLSAFFEEAEAKWQTLGLPVAVESPHVYLPAFHYTTRDSEESRYFLVLDWEAAQTPGNILNAPGDYRIMSALKRHYSFHNIIESSEFLDRYDRFLILDEGSRRWSEVRIEGNPNYKVELMGAIPGIQVLLVESAG